MKVVISFLLFTFALSEKYNLESLEKGKRGDDFRVWVYFNDKSFTQKIHISNEALERRKKHSIQSDNLWYDYKVSELYKYHISALGIKIINESRWLNAVSLICESSQLDQLASLPFVDKITPVIGYKKHFKNFLKSDSRDYDYGNSQEQIEQINAHELHNMGFTGEGIRILVMDTGFDLSHDAFMHINIAGEWDFINNDNETADENSDEQNQNQDYHGTAVLSTIAGYDPGQFIGVAFDAEFLLAKTESVADEYQGEEDNYIAGLEWGEANGADIVSTSLGYLDWYDYEDMDGNTAITTNGIDIAVGLGMLCVTAAGNEGNDDWYYIIAPADADSVISVGAVNSEGEIQDFSSHGPTYDGRIKPEVCARGRLTWCVSPGSLSEYTRLSGTSLACPLVAGASALICQAQSDWSPMQIREAIMMTASQSDSPDNEYGYGIINISDAIEYEPLAGINHDGNLLMNHSIISTYPNPFNPSITIDIQSKVNDRLDVRILSLDGKVIESLFSGLAFNNLIKLNWNPDNLSSGMYIVQTTINNNNNFKKITYLK